MAPETNILKTTCSYCGVGCGIEIEKLPDGSLKLRGDKKHPVNYGKLCAKGMNLHHVVQKKHDRLLYPQIRLQRKAELQRVSWDTAMQHTADVFKKIIAEHGPDSVGFYVSGQCLTEEYYVVNKLAKAGIGTNNIDTNSRLCMSSAVVGYKKALGEDAVPIAYEDIDQCDTLFITGANPAWCHPILFRRIEERKAKYPDLKIIVADPRKTQSASSATLHLQLRPGTDTVLNNAIGRCIIENGHIDTDFISNYSEGYEAYKAVVMETELSEAADICGVEAADIQKAAELIGTSPAFISMWAMGLNQSTEGVNKNLSLINLSLITGQIGKPGAGPFSLTGQPNAMGGREVGGMCNLLPAHRDLANPAHREEVARFWGVDSVPEKPGLTATEMVEALDDGRLKAIWIICTNPAVSIPNARLLDSAMKKAELVVVQEVSERSDSLQYADVVLPAAGWLEKKGTMTNSERRISMVKPYVDAPGEARPDVDILCDFAHKMGLPGFDFANEEAVFDEHKALTKNTNLDISGLSYQYLNKVGTTQWPFPEGAQSGTVRLFDDFKFYTPSGKAQIAAVSGMAGIEALTEAFPLVLTTGRIRDQWHTMTRTGKVQRLNKHIPKAFLEIHPADAQLRGIEQDAPVLVTSAQGDVTVTAIVTDTIKQGTVFLPMHWGKVLQSDHGRANNLTKLAVDPVSKEPDFKFTAVQVQQYVKPKEKIVIVGAGAAAYSFITEHRKLNTDDELHVFSAEQHMFYNRILLPEYVSGHKQWEQLASVAYEEIEKLSVQLYAGTAVIDIDRQAKTITDSKGIVHSYDRLVLATGARANVPQDIPLPSSVFKIRNKDDAERLQNYVAAGDKVLVVGSGLLGVEIAGSLTDMGCNVSVLNRSTGLMNKQLDAVGSLILNDILRQKNISIHENSQIKSMSVTDGLLNVELSTGTSSVYKAVVFAIGTLPNIELAQNAGLKYKRGVAINAYFETSDPDIHAIGEIAEFCDQMWGIRNVAEEHGRLLASSLAGYKNEYYTGSVSMNILKLTGTKLMTIGEINPPADDPAYEEVVFMDVRKHCYKKCVIKEDTLVGAILIGDTAEFDEFRQLIEDKTELLQKRAKLLRPAAAAKNKTVSKGKTVCSCHNVGTGNIDDAIKEGCTSVEAIMKKTKAGKGCGSCKPELKNILEKSVMPELK